MLVFIEQRHIDAAQRTRRDGTLRDGTLPWGCRCPIARALCEQLDLPLGAVYAGPVHTWVNWKGYAAAMQDMVGSFPEQSRLTTAKDAFDFMNDVDNVCNVDSVFPTTVTLQQQPMHCPPLSPPNGTGDGKPAYP